MKKVSMNFLNRLEMMIFKSFPENYEPVSSAVAMSSLISAFATAILIFILQMGNASESTAGTVMGVMWGVAFFYCVYVVYKAMQCLITTTSTGAKVGLGFYALTLFAVCAVLFSMLAVLAIIVALVLLVLWIVLKVAFPDKSGSKKRIRVRYGDGSTEEMVEDGHGATGETFYKGDKGGWYTD